MTDDGKMNVDIDPVEMRNVMKKYKNKSGLGYPKSMIWVPKYGSGILLSNAAVWLS